MPKPADLQIFIDEKHNRAAKYLKSNSMGKRIVRNFALSRKKVKVADPAKGVITYSQNEFLNHWISSELVDSEQTGITLLLEPTPSFYEEEGEKEHKLSWIPKVATASGFLATIQLDNGLETNLKNNIQYKNVLKAKAFFYKSFAPAGAALLQYCKVHSGGEMMWPKYG